LTPFWTSVIVAEMRTSCCEGILIGVMDYGEADRIGTFFTLEYGKLRGIARGAKRSVRRFGGVLELFARLRLQIILREGLSTVSAADIVTIHPGIRSDLPRIGHAGYACELVDLLLPERLHNPRLFRLLAAYLERLDQFPATPSDRRFFEINLLNILGYRPALEHCAGCGGELAGGAFLGRVPVADGLFCGRCGAGGGQVAASTVAQLLKAMSTGRFGMLSFTDDELAEAGQLLDIAIAAHISRPLKSLPFLLDL